MDLILQNIMLSNKEREIDAFGISQGKSDLERMRAISQYRNEFANNKPGRIRETLGDIKETFEGVGSTFREEGERIRETLTRPEPQTALDRLVDPLERATEIGASFFRGGSRAFGEVVVGAGKVALGQETEEKIKTGVEGIAGKVAQSENVKDVVNFFNSLPEGIQRQARNIAGFGEGLLEITGLGRAKKVVAPAFKTGLQTAKEGAESGVKKVQSLFTRPAKSVDDAIDLADQALKDSPSAIRELAEQGAVQPSIREKFIGLTPDIKKRIKEAGPENLQQYIDVVNARNLDDTVPTPYEFGGQRVQSAVDELYRINNETGSAIGQTRQKLATVKAPSTSVQAVDNTFKEGLEKLNLTIRNGQVVQKPGTIAKTGAAGDIKVLNDLYAEFLKFKQSPTLRNMIDLRSLVDGKINFAKGAREASNSVDPFSRSFRSSLADEASTLVGKTGAGDLAKYSEFMDALATLESYTGRKAGGEYLLRLVLSGRGGDARKIIATVKELTGIDLMNDATLMTVVTDLLGNKNTKNLFRQEITSAGFDALRALSGDPKGAMNILGDYLQRKFLDEETILKEAAQPSFNKGVIPEQLNIGDDLVSEAKKYKSAEEFVEAQGTPVFRGEPTISAEKSAGIGKSFTTDQKIAEVYGNKGKIIEGFVDNKDILRYNELDASTKKYIKSIIDENIDMVKVGLENENIKPFERLVTELGEIARIKNKKAVDISSFGIPSESEIRILSSDIIKTKSQLTDIWNKANK